MSDVFISYSRDDLERVTLIAKAVQREGYDLWWDADLPPHRSYGDVIQEKIGSAKAVIVVWSEEATKSEWVRAEADMARNQRKLVQTSIDDGMPPLPFNQIQYASLSDWNGESDHPSWRKILVSLSDLVGAAPNPEAATTPKPKLEATSPPPPPQPEGEQRGSQLPLMISLISLVAVAGLLAWVFLGGEKEKHVPSEGNSQVVETTDPVQATPATESQPGKTAPLPSNQFNESAFTDDPDGWTNVRAGPSRSSSIIGRVKKGEVFNTHKQPGQWWKIRTDDGVEGYMHYSLISLTASRPEKAKMIFPDSDSRLISATEMHRLSKSELRIARNEIFARKGRIFTSADLREHFERFGWYRPTSTEVEVNDIEKVNAQVMQAEEQSR